MARGAAGGVGRGRAELALADGGACGVGAVEPSSMGSSLETSCVVRCLHTHALVE